MFSPVTHSFRTNIMATYIFRGFSFLCFSFMACKYYFFYLICNYTFIHTTGNPTVPVTTAARPTTTLAPTTTGKHDRCTINHNTTAACYQPLPSTQLQHTNTTAALPTITLILTTTGKHVDRSSVHIYLIIINFQRFIRNQNISMSSSWFLLLFTGSCNDRMSQSQCESYKKYGYCKSYVESMKYYCPKTCYSCGE